MQTKNTPLSKSRVKLEFEVPAERLDKAMIQAVARLSREARVPGFRPGKAPRGVLEAVLGPKAVLEEALDLVVSDAWREAVKEGGFVPLSSPEIDVTQGVEGKPVLFKATVPVTPEVKLGDVEHFKFKPEVLPVDDAKVNSVVDELRDANGHLETVTDRGAAKGDYAIIGFTGTRDGAAFPGGTSDRMPLIIGDDRLIPGFEDHLVGMKIGDERGFDIKFPEDYQEESLRGAPVHFEVGLKDLRTKVLPEATDEFANEMGKFAGMAEMRAELRKRLEATALDRARHDFADKIIEYATTNATAELPDILVDQEVEVMHDELRSALARQGITEEAYLKVTGKTDEQIHQELRPDAEKRGKTLLVLTEVAKARGVEVPDKDIEAEVARARGRYADSPNLIRYFESERGRNYIRSTLRRSRTVEQIIDEWLAAHPEAPRLVHLEDVEEAAVDGEGSVPSDASAAAGAQAAPAGA